MSVEVPEVPEEYEFPLNELESILREGDNYNFMNYIEDLDEKKQEYFFRNIQKLHDSFVIFFKKLRLEEYRLEYNHDFFRSFSGLYKGYDDDVKILVFNAMVFLERIYNCS